MTNVNASWFVNEYRRLITQCANIAYWEHFDKEDRKNIIKLLDDLEGVK